MVRWRPRIASLLIGTALALALLEGALRFVWHYPPGLDPVFGRIPMPGATVRIGTEGWGKSHWSIRGVRGGTPPVAGRPAVIAVGDSYTQAMQVDDDQVFTALVEEALRARGLDVQVLNVGRSGVSAADYVASGDAYLRTFSPVWTVVTLRPNDITTDAFDPSRRHFIEDDDGTLHVQGREVAEYRGPGARPLLWLRQRINLLNFGLARFFLFREALRNEAPLFRGADATQRSPAKQSRTEWPIEAVLSRIAAVYGERITFLYLAPYPERGTVRDDVAIDRRIQETCATGRWSCVSLADSFQAFTARREAPYGFANTAWNRGHMNAAGHRAAAGLLARELVRQPLVR